MKRFMSSAASSSSDRDGSAGLLANDSNSNCFGSAEQPVSDEGGEMQPNKRSKHDRMMVSLRNFITPEILQPIKAALAKEIDKFKLECEGWDPPSCLEDTTKEDKPKFLLREVYDRLRSMRVRKCLPAYTRAQTNAMYAVIKGLLALLHSDVQSCHFRASERKQIGALMLYHDWCLKLKTIECNASNVELLTLAMHQEMINPNMDPSKYAARYLKYLADFAELHAL